MIIQEIRVPIPLPSIPQVVENLSIVEPLDNEEHPINDQQLHNMIISNELMNEAPKELALRRSQIHMRLANSDDVIHALSCRI